MRKKRHSTRPPLTRLGAPEAGMVTALAAGRGEGTAIFAGTPAGVFRTPAGQAHGFASWQRCPGSPAGVLALAISPAFDQDHSLWAGTHNGVFLSTNGGASWARAHMPISGAAIMALSCSPGFAADGLLLAGTLEDGVLYSNDRGQTWQSKSFGLLDASVLCLAFSPGVERDETVFAGGETSLYYSYNRALAWKELPVPEALAPVLSLLVSPRFETDHTLYLGSEQQGLFRSADRGATWQRLDVPANCINALLHWPDDRSLVAATEAGTFRSADGGGTWYCWLSVPDVISLAGRERLLAAGTAERGAWATDGVGAWQAAANLPARSVSGLELSPRFHTDQLAFMFGQREGLWRSTDGGHRWADLSQALPSPEILDASVSPQFAADGTVVAASSAGLLVGSAAGSAWRAASETPASLAAFSPDGKRLAASFPGHGIATTQNLGAAWQAVPGPWDGPGEVAALAINNAGQLYVGWREAAGDSLSFWQGTPGQFEPVLTVPAGENPVIRLYVPPEPAAHRPWYVGLGSHVWTLSSRIGQTPVQAEVFEAGAAQENIISLAGLQAQGVQRLLAATGQHLYESPNGKDWAKIYEFGSDPVAAMALSPNFAHDRTAYVLLLGGVFARAVIP
jgi:photosystem II stability/assembly factor-like uncharacterized protein